MADSKISDLTELTSLADSDEFVVVDKSDTTQAITGSTKKVLASTISSRTETLTNKTIGDTLNINGAITQTGTANHITLTPGTSKLVKIAVLRKDNTTNTYNNGSVVLTGWSFGTGTGAVYIGPNTVTFGITFSDRPVVLHSYIGYKDDSDPSNIGDFGALYQGKTSAFNITTTSFQYYFNRDDAATIENTRRLGISWIAIGIL